MHYVEEGGGLSDNIFNNLGHQMQKPRRAAIILYVVLCSTLAKFEETVNSKIEGRLFTRSKDVAIRKAQVMVQSVKPRSGVCASSMREEPAAHDTYWYIRVRV